MSAIFNSALTGDERNVLLKQVVLFDVVQRCGNGGSDKTGTLFQLVQYVLEDTFCALLLFQELTRLTYGASGGSRYWRQIHNFCPSPRPPYKLELEMGHPGFCWRSLPLLPLLVGHA